jgi:hypothetical protein
MVRIKDHRRGSLMQSAGVSERIKVSPQAHFLIERGITMKVFSLLLLVAILLGSCAPMSKNIKADEEYQMTFVDKMKILGGLFVAYLKDTDYEPREQRKYIIYDRWNNYLPIYDVVEVAPNPVSWRDRRDEKKLRAWSKKLIPGL